MRAFYLLLPLVLLSALTFAQTPGIVVRPTSGAGPSVLNPNADRYTSASAAGFITSDITESEIPYKIIKPLYGTEPTGDLATGPNGGYTDIVKTTDGSGCYMYYDGTNLLFRVRIGDIVSGAKAYNILFDTDLKIGAKGASADPNYVPATNSGNGNAGFEWEVALLTGTNGMVAIYNVDGTVNPSVANSYSLTTNQLISVALSRESGNADYFYDFFVPASALGITAATPFRVVVTTNTNPGSAFQGTRSDIYGIDDTQFANTTDAWEFVATYTPSFTLNSIGASGSGPGAACTSAPTVNSGIASGTNVSVGGTWTKLAGSTYTSATITVYKNGVSQGTTTCNSAGNWTFTVSSIAVGDVITAAAKASGESQCLLSNSVVATACSPANTSNTSSLVITCLSGRGIGGTRPAGARVKVYTISPSGSPVLFADDATTTYKVTYNGGTDPTSTTAWEYQHSSNGGTADPCGGGATDMPANSYVFTITESGKCESGWVFTSAVTGSCISTTGGGAMTGTQTAAPTITQTVAYPTTTTISGTAAASSTVRLLINNFIVASTTANAGGAYSFTYTGGFQTGDVVAVRAQQQTSGSNYYCVSPAASLTVTCFTSAPLITTDALGNLSAGTTSVSGTSSEPNGTTIRVFLSPSTQIGSGIVSNGTWTATVTALVAGSSYYASAQNGSCSVSAASASATAKTTTTICPTITGTYIEGAATVSGTLPSSFTGTVYLYQDGTVVGSTNVTSATSWTVTVNSATPLSAGGVLTVGAQATNGTLNRSCASTTTVTCAPPSSPTVDPTTTSIPVGSTVTYTVSGSQSDVLYSVTDVSGSTNYATSSFGTGSSLSLTTQPFNSVGTYNLKTSALALTSGGCQTTSSMSLSVISAMPVTWVDFSAVVSGSAVNLKWVTANEYNVKDFIILYSADGMHWNEAGTMAPRNLNSQQAYRFTHANPVIGINYYKVRQRDVDGRFSETVTRRVNIGSNSTKLLVFPNPAQGSTVHVQLARATTVEVMDKTGKRLIIKAMKAGVQPLDISTLPPGSYVVKAGAEQASLVRY